MIKAFTEDKDAHDMQNVMVKLNMHSSLKTNYLFERFIKGESKESFHWFVAALRDIICKRKFYKNCKEIILQDHITSEW